MFSHWSRPQLGLAPQAVQEVLHRKQNLATRGCVIASDCVDNSGCPWDVFPDTSQEWISDERMVEVNIMLLVVYEAIGQYQSVIEAGLL